MQHLFPPRPAGIDEELTHPSPAFKKEVVKVFFLCIVFLLWYLVLLATTVGIAFLIGFLAVTLFLHVGHFATAMLALGAIIMGLMLIYFMLKALVVKKGEPIPTVGEVTKESEPVFFEFIKQVCLETKAPFPRKIYLVNDINAFVSYHSTFLSLFLPTRKDLYIGLGLVNSSTISELKAVVAHEFGHFSQGSMRFGSYVYHFNQIIYKIVNDNPNYNALIERWAGYSSYFAIFAHLNFAIIRGIRWLMARFYGVLNKGYMGLSRQMEFHADAVAARVSGSAPLISSLYRFDLATVSYDHLLSYYNDLIKENLKADNLYTHHLKLMQLLATHQAVEIKNGFPMIDGSTINQMGRSRITVKDQWASHPTVEEREAALLRYGIASENVSMPAWDLFSEAEELQKRVTSSLYEGVSFSGEPLLLSDEDFEERYQEFLRVNSFQPVYKGYYDSRYIDRFDLSLTDYLPEDLPFEVLFSEEYLQIPKLLSSLENDMAALESIVMEGSDYKSFDFDGQRYPVHDAGMVKMYMEKELKQTGEELKKHDQEIFYVARRSAVFLGTEHELEAAFLDMFAQTEATEQDIKFFQELFQEVSKAYTQLPFAAIQELVARILEKEKLLKNRLEEILADEKILRLASLKEDLELARRFCDSQHLYFADNGYRNDELDLLNDASRAFLNLSTRYSFEVKKLALECQLRLLKPKGAGVQVDY
ncbi:M48 family metallopeptidase [Pedobacter sp. SYSU D00535]|uniref:M48 family metallopeptidase n=1 Tax=Pedobacter sp. SYSU D00535 TaxID=2810308 RepID=UPI001A962198|nr:M48 family metallopeptidase [Pedobacter sp. SYSU D00535]